MLRFKGRFKGFAQRTHSIVEPTPFLPSDRCPHDLWRSPVDQRLIREDLFEFFNDTTEPDSPLFRLAIHDARDAFHLKSKVRMLHLKEVFEQPLEIWSRSPGLPWRDLGYKTKDDVRRDPHAILKVRKFWHLVKHNDAIDPPDSCAFVRAHVVQRPELKVRAVWGYPATVTFGEAVFALPLIRAYQRGGSPIAYGFETGAAGFSKLRSVLKGNSYCGIDFSKFDKTVPSWLIRLAFYILADNIDFKNYEGYGVAEPTCMWRMYEYIMDYFVNTTIRLANGDRWQKSSGIASGSYFTQLIGSVCNYILLRWFCYEAGVTVDGILVFGDDSLLATRTPIDLDVFASMAEKVGMHINLEKSGVSQFLDRLRFLGFYVNHGMPLKPRNEWLASLYFPENPDKTWDDVASRALGLYYANQGVDEYISDLCASIVHLRPFDVQLSHSMRKMLSVCGHTLDKIGPDLPSKIEFLYRMKVL
uniref:RdRp n=1 Tax=Hubei partiti-like virus 45 TaxID=1923053 RepID=A0A1L3KLN6_9VIRU|nr:RdRp [Hubei partiti-like virus 45]